MHRCRNAHLVVVDSLERFHESQLTEEWLVHMIYIIARGLPVTTQEYCAGAQGDVRRISKSGFIEHERASEVPVELLIQQSFRSECPEVLTALRECCSGDALSKWSVVRKFSKPPSNSTGSTKKKYIEVSSLTSLWQSIQVLRRVKNSSDAPFVWKHGRAAM